MASYAHRDVVACLADLAADGRQWITTNVIWRLAQHGFCTVSLDVTESSLREALSDADRLEGQGRFAVTPAEIAEGLLGPEGSTEICELDATLGSTGPRGLRSADEVLTAVGAILESDYLEAHLGFSVGHRSNSLLHLARGLPEKQAALTEAQCQHWLDQFVRQRLMLVLFLGPQGGTLELQPLHREGEVLEVQVEPGTLVVFRADQLSRRFHALPGGGGAAALSCFLGPPRHAGGASEEALAPAAWALLEWCKARLGFLRAQMRGDEDAEVEHLDIPRNWKLAMNHLYSNSSGKQVSIQSVSCRFPNAINPQHFGAAIAAGTDLATEIPQNRFKWWEWYDENPEGHKWMKAYSMHGAFVEGADLFDNRMFGISMMEAQGMDPTQFLLLEAGYEALNLAGHRKKDLMNSLIGVYVGQGMVEIAPKEAGVAMGGTGAARAVSCGRISFCLGIQGPCCTIDAHGATAFVCLEVGFQSLRNQAKSFKTALCGSVMLTFSPMQFVSSCAAGYLSPVGRCCSFDATAQGYVKGEGCGFACLKPGQEVVDGKVLEEGGNGLGFFGAIEVSSLGRAARLGAPSAAAEQVVIADALRCAELSPLNVEVVECVGDGALLSDAVEGSYLARCLRFEEPGTKPLQLGAVMSQVGFMREAAGFAQLVKLLESLKYGAFAPNLHLHQLNPHADEGSMESLNPLTESVACRLASNFAGCTSRGLGGTVTHAVIGVPIHELMPLTHVLPHAAPAHESIAFWPAGGGLLEEEAEPAEGYSVVGSWSGWAEAEPAEEEEVGVYGLTIALGETLIEEFQIWVDGNPQRALHPARPAAPAGTPPLGPHGEGARGQDFCWAIDGREYWTCALGGRTSAEGRVFINGDTTPATSALAPLAVPGAVGDRYRIRLRVAGRWRVVDWERLGVAAGAPTVRLPIEVSSTPQGLQAAEQPPREPAAVPEAPNTEQPSEVPQGEQLPRAAEPGRGNSVACSPQ